jgi:allantoicase
MFQLAFAGQVRQLIVDTAHFKYNASAEVAAYGYGGDAAPPAGSPDWQPLLARTRLQPDTRHVLPVSSPGPVAWVRIDAFPDGGLSRVRVIGSIDPAARGQAGYRWLNSLPAGQAVRCLTGAGLAPDMADDVAGQRPLTGAWLEDFRRRHEETDLTALAIMLEGRV